VVETYILMACHYHHTLMGAGGFVGCKGGIRESYKPNILDWNGLDCDLYPGMQTCFMQGSIGINQRADFGSVNLTLQPTESRADIRPGIHCSILK
jgi:hypothetical protein